MKLKKLSSPPEQEEVQSMVNYARNVIEEFRKAKHFRHILLTFYKYFLPLIPLTKKYFFSGSLSTELNSLPVVASFFSILPIVTVP